MTPATLPARRPNAATERAWNPDEEGSAYRRVTPDMVPGAAELDQAVSRQFWQLSRQIKRTPTKRRVPAPAAPGRTLTHA